jgi:hypothetical protein
MAKAACSTFLLSFFLFVRVKVIDASPTKTIPHTCCTPCRVSCCYSKKTQKPKTLTRIAHSHSPTQSYIYI